MDPLDQLVQSFPNDFNTCTQPQETAQPSSSEPDAPASEASSPDSSSQEAASSEPAEPAEASGDPSEPAIPANSDNAIELSNFISRKFHYPRSCRLTLTSSVRKSRSVTNWFWP